MTPVEASRAMYDHLRSGEWAELEQFFTEDFVIYEPASLPYGGEWRGRDALQRLYAKVMTFWVDPKVEWIELIGSEKHVVAVLRMSMEPPGGGPRITQTLCELTEFTGSLMSAMRIHYFDTAQLAAALQG